MPAKNRPPVPNLRPPHAATLPRASTVQPRAAEKLRPPHAATLPRASSLRSGSVESSPSPGPATRAKATMQPRDGLLVQRMKRQRDKYFADPNDWHSDSSDSESEAEDETRTALPPNAKKRKLHHELIFNTTKREGKKTTKKVRRTKRDKTGKREMKRINNRVYRTDAWPDLEGDAQKIHHVIPELDKSGATNRSYGATTVLCCVFVVRKLYRKVCFSNAKGPMGVPLRKEAQSLGYHCIQAMQAHAEGEMVQYLRTYKDMFLVSMGCDKPHCKECNRMMLEYFEEPYETVSDSSDKVFKNYFMPKPLQDAVGFDFRPSEEFSDFEDF